MTEEYTQCDTVQVEKNKVPDAIQTYRNFPKESDTMK